MGEGNFKTTHLQQEVESEYWESILESIGDGFWVLDRQWRCTYINHRQAELIGMPQADVVGKNVWELFPDLVGSEFYRQLHGAVALKTPVHFEHFYPTWQGWFELRVYPSAHGVSLLAIAIGERKQAEEPLGDRQHLLQQLAEMSPGLLYLYDVVEQRNIYINARSLDWLGYPPETVLAMGRDFMTQVMHPDDLAQMPAHFERLNTAQEGSFFELEYRIRHVSGEWRWLSSRDTVFTRTPQGQVREILGTAQDITERKQTLELLRESEQRFQSFMNHSPTSAWIADKEGQLLYLSPTYFRMFQFQEQDAVGKNILDIYPDEFAQQFLENNKRVFATGQVVETIETAPRPDGSVGEFLVYKFPISSGSGETLLGGVAVDITQRRRVEKALRRQEEELRLITDSVPALIAYIDAECQYRFVNRAFTRWFGQSAEQIIGQTVEEFLGETVYQYMRRDVEAALAGQPVTDELWMPFKDGGARYVRRQYIPDMGTHGQVKGFYALINDITDLKQTEEALRKSETVLNAFLASSPLGLAVFDHDLRYLYANEALASINGLPLSAHLGHTLWDILPQMAPEFAPMFQQIMQTQEPVLNYEFSGEMTPGLYRHCLANHFPVCLPDGEVLGVGITVMDISELKRIEAALRESEALAQARAEELEIFMEMVPAAVWIAHDPQCNSMSANRSAYQLMRRTPDSVMTATPLDGDYPFEFKIQKNGQDIPPNELPMQQAGRTGRHVEGEFDFVFAESDVRSIYGRAVPLWDESGSVRGVIGAFLDVTDRKQAEEALRQSERRFRRFVESNIFGVAFGSFTGEIHYANDAFLNIIGYEPEELSQLRWDRLTPPEYLHLDQQAIGQLREHGASAPFEKEYIRKDGSRVPVLTASTLLEQPYAQQQEIACLFLNLTQLKQTKAALREQQLLLEIILKQAADAVIVCDATGKLTFVNAAARRLARQNPEDTTLDLDLLDWGEAFDPSGQLMALDNYAMSRALRGEASYAVESRMVHADGSYYDILLSAAPLMNEGQIIGAVATFMDITERKRVEEALRESNERLNLALAAAYMGDWSWDAATDVVTFSQRAAAIFGIVPGPYMTWTQMRELLHEQDRDRARLEVERAILEHGDYDIEYRVIRPDGVPCWVAAKGRAQYDGSGQVLSMIGVVQDITDYKHAQHALQESEATARARAQELEALMEITPVALWIAHDPNCHQMSANQIAYDLMRATPGSVATATPPDGSYPLQFKQRSNGQELASHELPMQRSIRTGQEITDELEFVFEDGTVRFMYGKAVPLRNETGSVRGAIGAFVDVTQRKHAEREREQLLARERAAREQAEAANRIKDEFLAVLSHELRSPLNPILGWTKLLRTRKFDEQATHRALEIIERNATLQTQLIEDLLDVSRILQGKMVLNVSPVNLATTIEAALETVRLAAEAKSIQLQTNLAPNVGLISGDAARLQQVVWNLVSNAVKFTPPGGRVEIRLENVEASLKVNRLNVERSEDNLQPSTQYAQIKVSDTGKGIKPEFLPYVFEYFRQADSTTTRKFGGLGLGLAIVRHLVELHGGSVLAESAGEGLGATFTVRLPLMEAPHQALDQVQFDHLADLSGLQVLMVDDEADIRELVAFILEEFGARVTVTASAKEALAALTQSVPDVLLSDIGMPDVDGYRLMRQVRALPAQQGGELRAIALTAYAGEYNQQQALEAGFQLHLSKPVEPEVLVSAIARLVGRAE